ncbi:hypothetical protein QQ045_024819 [Rhodiola kirilowii]
MASTKSSSSSSSSWTRDEDKKFENALAMYAENSPNRWENVVRHMGGTKTVDQVKQHYQLLVEDINNIEAGKIPPPNYEDATTRMTKHRRANLMARSKKKLPQLYPPSKSLLSNLIIDLIKNCRNVLNVMMIVANKAPKRYPRVPPTTRSTTNQPRALPDEIRSARNATEVIEEAEMVKGFQIRSHWISTEIEIDGRNGNRRTRRKRGRQRHWEWQRWIEKKLRNFLADEIYQVGIPQEFLLPLLDPSWALRMMQMKVESGNQRVGADAHRPSASAVYSQPWWQGYGNTDNSLPGINERSLRSMPENLNAVTVGVAINVNKDKEIPSGIALRPDGYNGQENQTSTPIQSTMSENPSESSQRELVGHSMVMASYPYQDPSYGAIVPPYGQQPLVHPQLFGVHQARMPLPLEMEEEPVYVNAKQYNGIMRRRQIRAKAELEKKIIKNRKVKFSYDTSPEPL